MCYCLLSLGSEKVVTILLLMLNFPHFLLHLATQSTAGKIQSTII